VRWVREMGLGGKVEEVVERRGPTKEPELAVGATVESPDTIGGGKKKHKAHKH